MAVDDYGQRVVKGLVLLLAVGFDRFIQERQRNPSESLFVQILNREIRLLKKTLMLKSGGTEL
ncbi:MAG: hypothetical protein ACLTDI_12990 [Acutalibacteraceae bacterium]